MDSPPLTDPQDQPEREGGDNDISLLLSPSKARRLAATSALWRHVDTRLESLFAPALPPSFERNGATLTALLDLMRANEGADEQRKILHEARAEALSLGSPAEDAEEGGKRDGQSGSGSGSESEKLLSGLEHALTARGRVALDDVAASAVLLACPDGRVEGLERRIMQTTTARFEAENELLSLLRTQRDFGRERRELLETLANFQAETDPEVLRMEEMQMQTQGMNRETKVVGMKLAEYQERIRALQSYDAGAVSMKDVVASEKGVQGRQEELLRCKECLLRMHGLPPDLERSREEVRRARDELEEWKRRRDKAFEGLVA